MSTEPRARAWIEISGHALRRNLRTIREVVGPDPALIPMVKADGYGLGAVDVVRVLDGEEPRAYGVATVAEGRELREAGVQRPIFVSSPTPPGAYAAAVTLDLTLSVSSLEAVELLAKSAREVGRTARFHLEVDTGMGRAGFDWREAATWGMEVVGRMGSDVVWEGCFTHFHSADEAESSSTDRQWSRFQDVLDTLPVPREELMVHACNSAGALRKPEYAADGVRPGIFLYGAVAGVGIPRPRPVVAVRARVVHVREAPPGTSVGYGATHRAAGWARWATLGIGYGDGLSRALGNRGHALIAGRRVPIVGRISMDVTVVDITDVEGVEPGDAATLLGRDAPEEITLEEVGEHMGTINYEVLTGLTPRLPRVWLSGPSDEGADPPGDREGS